MTPQEMMTATPQEIEQRIAELKTQISDMQSKLNTSKNREEPYSDYLIRLGKSVAQQNPEKAQEIYDLAYRARYSEAQGQRNVGKEAQALLDNVAATFMNVKPNDQVSWAFYRNKWIASNPDLEQFIPAQASQDAWDAIQAQGGRGKEVAPKSDYAQQQDIERRIGQLTTLATQNAQSNPSLSAMYTKQANELYTKLNPSVGTDGKTVDGIIKEYQSDINALVGQVTQNSTPSTITLFGKLANALGEGALLNQVRDSIKGKLNTRKEELGGAIQYNDEQLKSMADKYTADVTLLRTDKDKIDKALGLIRDGITNGGAAMIAKGLQGDVLAEAEIARYVAGGVWAQLGNKLRNTFGLVSQTDLETVKKLASSLVDAYNGKVDDYYSNPDIKGNKYAVGGLKKVTPLGDVKLGSGSGSGGGNTTKHTKEQAQVWAKRNGYYDLGQNKNGVWVAVDTAGNVKRFE